MACEPWFAVSVFDVIELDVVSSICVIGTVEFESPKVMVPLSGSENAYCGKTIITATERKRKSLRSISHDLQYYANKELSNIVQEHCY
jgi:hypothetical protein